MYIIVDLTKRYDFFYSCCTFISEIMLIALEMWDLTQVDAEQFPACKGFH